MSGDDVGKFCPNEDTGKASQEVREEIDGRS